MTAPHQNHGTIENGVREIRSGTHTIWLRRNALILGP